MWRRLAERSDSSGEVKDEADLLRFMSLLPGLLFDQMAILELSLDDK